MKKHLLKFGVYYIIFNFLIYFFWFSTFIFNGIKKSEDGIYKCQNLSHVYSCDFGNFLINSIVWAVIIVVITFVFVQLILFASSLVSYLILNILNKKFEKVNEISVFVKFLIFFLINIFLLIPLIVLYFNFSPDQL